MTVHLRVSPTERVPLTAALRHSCRRGWVEYDPTRITLTLDALATGGDLLPLTVPMRHAILDVLRWTNSAEQRTRWPKDALDALKAIRARLERGGDSAEEPEPWTAPAPVEQPALTLW